MDSFLLWMGGKRILSKYIAQIMPQHICYVEVFGGAGWVLFRKRRSKSEVYNDINSDLINLFRVVKGNVEKLVEALQCELHSRQLFEEYTENYEKGEPSDPVEKAAQFYNLVTMSFSAHVGQGWRFGTKSNAARPINIEELRMCHRRLTRVQIEHDDYKKLIPRYDRETTLFYVDPPYYQVGGGKYDGQAYYGTPWLGIEHSRLATMLRGIKGKFILSYNDDPMVKHMYKWANIQVTKLLYYSSAAHKQVHVSELLITNFKLNRKIDEELDVGVEFDEPKPSKPEVKEPKKTGLLKYIN